MLCWLLMLAVVPALAVEVQGVKAEIAGESTAKIALEAAGKFEIRMALEPAGEREAVTIHVELPGTGPETWPSEDVYVIDEAGKGIPIRRNGIEWHRLTMTVPPVRHTYTIRADTRERPKQIAETERTATDPVSGITASICLWHGGKEAALCMRFDDSHPTHLSKAIPILGEYGYRATFMINPGNSGFQEHKEAWETVAQNGEHEFANHTMHHHGADGETEIRREVGNVSEYIWSLFPHRSKLIALNRGGGTQWTTIRPFRDYLEQYHLFSVTGSLGMDDVYGGRAKALETHIARHIERRGWCRVHFHSIGEEMASSEKNFRAALDVVKNYENRLWITGLADAYKYQEERKAAGLALLSHSPDSAVLQLTCGADPELYDQQLTIRLDLPYEMRSATVILQKEGEPEKSEIVQTDDPQTGILWIDVPPQNARYTLTVKPNSAEKK